VIRWANNGSLDDNKVEFEIKYYWDGIMEQPIEVAKLIKPEYPELEGTMNLCNDIIEKRTGKMTEEEWQAAEKAQTSTKTSIEWLIEEMLSKGYFKESVTLTNIDHLQYKVEEMHKQEIIDAYERGDKYKTEISDEEIENYADEHTTTLEMYVGFLQGAKWYREQLKTKKMDLKEIDRTTKEGRLLFAALAKITTESQTDKTPYEVLEQLEDLATKMDE
jgi:hypothetical protein